MKNTVPKFKFVVDTREQTPYCFSGSDIVQKLDTGDYSIEGYEEIICIERKSLNDFISSVLPTRGWLRFQKELWRMQEMEQVCIVVEGQWSDLCSGNYRSKVHPHSLQGFAMRIMVDFDIPVYFVSSHTDGQAFVDKWLRRAALKYLSTLEGENDECNTFCPACINTEGLAPEENQRRGAPA